MRITYSFILAAGLTNQKDGETHTATEETVPPQNGVKRSHNDRVGGYGLRLEPSTGGEGGIRTLVTVSRKHAFQACAFNHSATSPGLKGSDFSLPSRLSGPLLPATNSRVREATIPRRAALCQEPRRGPRSSSIRLPEGWRR